MTGQYLLPTDDDFVNSVARSIARTRWEREAGAFLKAELGEVMARISPEDYEASLELVFNGLWNGTSKMDEEQRDGYRADARAAIASINLNLLTRS